MTNMYTLLKKIIFLFPFALFYIGVDRYGVEETAKTVEIDSVSCFEGSGQPIVIQPGERVKLVLTSGANASEAGAGHHFVLLKSGANESQFVEKNTALLLCSGELHDSDFNKEVIATSDLRNTGETSAVWFDAPNIQGDYPYFCSTPGHFENCIKGILHVRKR